MDSKDLQNRIIIFLLAVIIVLQISRSGEGRYAIGAPWQSMPVVLDTKTSKLWFRSATENVCLGTNEKPELRTVKAIHDPNVY